MSSEDPYAHAVPAKLKMKGDGGIKKKKKNKKKAKQLVEEISLMEENETEETKFEVKRTKAEIAFLNMREKNQTKRILEKATVTHKEKVEKFNRDLDNLTEFYDIPKVSWTK
ncbi:PREDICTED: protein FAM32A-like [Nicrophorus vespilloides]|uniref:Protein FAM32A-like n=1 Tax=Nicrophorus vespilloides TaxID=110193 RepID=A0ABM1MK95_NICVS|nr:PREDICTED: protein FAM32A-like [Nicrophorus vespilloides]